jgi:hypothetical protein
LRNNRGYLRWQRKRIIKKKFGILKRLGGEELVMAWTNGELGRLAKGKIHCSCWMCRIKSYDQVTHRDARQNVAMMQQMRLGW